MRKRWRTPIVAVICLALGIAAATFMLGCFDNNDPKDEPATGKVTLAEDGSADLSWAKVKGASAYRVYYSPGRFGEYSYIAKTKKMSYSHHDGYGYYQIEAVDEGGNVLSTENLSWELQTFGENVHIYSPSDDMEAVQDEIDSLIAGTFGGSGRGQFTSSRYAGLFKSNESDDEFKYDLDLKMGYYMQYSGLGLLPTDVTINKFNVYGELSGGNATCNFWRDISNLTVDSNVQWAVSQATSFRRVKVNGDVRLIDSGSTPWGSGGFISDCEVTGTINAGGQQQWFTRNTKFKNWTNSDLNMVFVGCRGTLGKDYVWPTRRITDIEDVTVMREKPFLVFDEDNGYRVAIADTQWNYSGVSWLEGSSINYEYLPLSDFYVARSDKDTADTLNSALASGKHLLLTPGIYYMDKPLKVERADTIVMGIGLATLKIAGNNTDAAMKIADVDGVNVSGIIFDASTYSKTLVTVGGESKSTVRHEGNPIVLSDVYFRIGGAEDVDTAVDTTLLINANDVVGDNFWVWRADHSHGVGWERNVTKNGVIVNGDYVTVYGLMVEHFHEYQTIWNGENGYMVFYQSETPYEVPDQESWISTWNGVEYNGYSSYKVSDNVQTHTAIGIGVYYVSRGGVFVLDHAVEAPSNPGIDIQHIALANFTTGIKGGGISHHVNSYGNGVVSGVNSGSKTQWTGFIAGQGIE